MPNSRDFSMCIICQEIISYVFRYDRYVCVCVIAMQADGVLK